METEEKNSVKDGKISLTDAQIGKLQRKLNETIRRINEGTIDYDETVDVLQDIIIEGKSTIHLSVVKGSHEIKAIENLIDCDSTPIAPQGFSIERHKKGGFIKLESVKISLYWSKNQKMESIYGLDLRKEMAGKPVMNVNLLYYLVEHPELIPEEWKGKDVIFWGTIYRSPSGHSCVRCLNWDGRCLFWKWIHEKFGPDNPAALLG